MKAVKNNPIKTVLTMSVGFGIIFLFSNLIWSLYTSLIIGVLGLSSNKIAGWLDFLWMKFAKVLSFIVPNILLSAIFYLVLFPLSFLSKIFGNNDYLQLKGKSATLWVKTPTQNNKNTFEKMW
tara:strand:- start:907 stop:1275 length:369 start_codon:yes stop_codon:yes gene_type:complete